MRACSAVRANRLSYSHGTETYRSGELLYMHPLPQARKKYILEKIKEEAARPRDKVDFMKSELGLHGDTFDQLEKILVDTDFAVAIQRVLEGFPLEDLEKMAFVQTKCVSY